LSLAARGWPPQHYLVVWHLEPRAREGQTPVAANAVAPSKEGLLHRTFSPKD
jgi:hypothetical protein